MMNIKEIMLMACCVIPVATFAESIKQSTFNEIPEDELAASEASVFLNKKFSYVEDGAEPSEDASRVSAKLLLDRCLMLNKLNQYQESVEACNKLTKRYAHTPFADSKMLVAMAHTVQADNLVKLKRYEEALIAYDFSIRFMRQEKKEKAQSFISEMLLDKAGVLGEMQRVDDELATYAQIINEFGQSRSTEVQRNVAIAYLNQAHVFYERDRKKEMLYNYETVIRDYASSGDMELQELVAQAYNGRGFEYFLMAKKVWGTDNTEALKRLVFAKADFTQGVKLAGSDETRAILYGNEAYTLWLRGDTQQAEVKLKQALILDGDYIFETTLEDIKHYPTPQDAGFKALLERLWAVQKRK